MNKQQFTVAISLLGLKKSEKEVNELFEGSGEEMEDLKIRKKDLLSFGDFVDRVNASRCVNIESKERANVLNWFNGIYEVLVVNNDQCPDEGRS